MAIDLRKIYFPLRSNIGWFQTLDLQLKIENRFKEALLLYDQIFVEDGTYEASILESILFEIYYPPNTKSISRTISIEKDVKNAEMVFEVQPGGPGNKFVPLANGQSLSRYKVDYFELLNQIESNTGNFLTRVIYNDDRIPDEIKSVIDSQTQHDQAIVKKLKGHKHINHLVAKNLNRDLIASSLIGTSILVDPSHSKLLELKSKKSMHNLQFTPDKESAIVRRLIKVRAPNFEKLSIPQVIELRNDKLWQEFRSTVRNISSLITNEPDVLLDKYAFQEIVNDVIDRKLFEEIEKREKNGIELEADLILGGLSLIPVYGTAVTAYNAIRSLTEFLEQRNGWIAFLTKVSRMKPD